MLCNIPVRRGIGKSIRSGAALAAAFALAACTVAPGMHMATSAAPGAQDASARVSADALQVPVTEIDATLLQRIRTADEAAGAGSSALIEAPQPYLLGAGDVLQITVWDHPELAAALGAPGQSQVRPADAPAGFVVDQSGDIEFPYAGALHVIPLHTDR